MPALIVPQMDPKVLIFGPQALTFDANAFAKLRKQLVGDPCHRWALDTLLTLPKYWNEFSQGASKSEDFKGEQPLDDLNGWLSTGDVSQATFPLSNIVLSPLVVISQLIQYSTFLEDPSHGMADAIDSSTESKASIETLGLCIGILSSFAAACSRNHDDFERYGAVAIRLAMLIGGIVDAEDISSTSQGSSSSFSASWNSASAFQALQDIVTTSPESYISVFIDEKRATVTTCKQTAPRLTSLLKSEGIHVADVALNGRFHWKNHEKNVDQLIHFCDLMTDFQFPDASSTVFPSRSNFDGQYITSGKLHHIALRAILVEQSHWYTAVSTSQASTSSDASVFCFGTDRCVPPTISRKLGARLTYLSEVNRNGTSLSTQSLNGVNGESNSQLADLPDERIAVIGMSVNAPGAEDLEEFFQILLAGKSQHQEVPAERFGMETTWREADPKQKWFGNFIKDFDAFDHKFFKKSPREMASTDPQHRLALQIAYQAVEQSGYFSHPDFDKHIGCFMGVGNVDYESNIACYPANAFSATGNLKSFLAGKISHHFGFTGPSLTLDTACSSSSVAIHHACRAIIHGECSAALAGGVNLMTSPEWYQNLAGASFLSPTGQCKPFDAAADGYCRGEGAGVVFLKKYSTAVADGDQIFGVIASSKVYQNQNCTAITVPNAISLSQLFRDVVRMARLEPQQVSVVEAHGTGTSVGDPAEFDGIRQVFGGPIRSDVLSLGSVKGLVGHTECASGVISLIKTLLMLQERSIVPQASFGSFNPSLKVTSEDKIEIVTKPKPWDVDFRAALINNYGASGSNASLVITESPNLASPSKTHVHGAFPFWFGGLDERSLRIYSAKLRKLLQKASNSSRPPSLANLSFQVSRQSNRSLPQALIFSASSISELEQKLSDIEKGSKSPDLVQKPASPKVILCFGGQITTHVGLDKELYDNAAVLRKHLDQCDAMCASLGLDSIFPSIFQKTPIQDIVKLQTSLFSMQYACAKAWIDSGVQVTAAVGHSFGELSALAVSNAVSLRDALTMISSRARLVAEKWGLESGSMIAIEGDLADVELLVGRCQKAAGSSDHPSIACYNGPKSFTVGGSSKDIDLACEIAKADPIFSVLKVKKLSVTNAFHSALVDPLVDDLNVLGERISFAKPDFPLERSTERESTETHNARFLADHMRNPVYFSHAVQRLAKRYPGSVWLEAGSNSTVTAMASRNLGTNSTDHRLQPVNITSDNSFQFLVDSTLKLWKQGLEVTFWPHHRIQTKDYVPFLLPPYQFEKSRHWMDLKKPLKLAAPVAAAPQPEEPPKGLTTFLGFEDEEMRSARLQVNTTTDKFKKLISGHIMANVAAVCPGVFQLDIAIEGMLSLRPEFQDGSFVPELQGMENYYPLVIDDVRRVWLEAESHDEGRLIWDWKLMADTRDSTSLTHHTSGTIIFRPAGDAALKAEFTRLQRLTGYKRCKELLYSHDVDEVLSGRNIYRAFYEVIDYKEVYRNVTKIVGKGVESAGRVVKLHNGETWLDTTLADCFCQCAGIFVNIMIDKADVSERGIFVADGIDRWIRSPNIEGNASLPEVWEVFALHHKVSEKNYVSDIFAFDPRDGSLVEVVIGLSYQRVAMGPLKKILTRLNGPQAQAGLSLQDTSASQITTPSRLGTLKPQSAPTSRSAPTLTKPVVEPSKTKKVAKKAPKPAGPNVSAIARDILCNLSGLEPDEVKDESDLVDLGIDSLMGMELAREIEAAFKCTLETSQLMDLTTFRSLVVCVQTTLGLDNTAGAAEEEDIEEEVQDEEDETPEVFANGTRTPANGLTNGAAHSTSPSVEGQLAPSIVLDAFQEAKDATDHFITNGGLGKYYNEVMPRSTELCIAHIVNAFEELGCPIKSAVAGEKLERITYLPKHERFIDLIYGLLEEARLVDIKGSEITRTAVALPSKSVDVLLEELLRDEPIHSPEHKLTGLIGPKFAQCLVGKEEGIQLIFGTPEGREVVSDVYAKSPINAIWIDQAKFFLKTLLGKLPKDGEPLRILEMGAGTGGTTSKIVPLLAELGVPVEYTMTDLSSSLVAAGRKRFKKYPFMKFKVVNIETPPEGDLIHSQHLILATNCVHATAKLPVSTENIRRILRPDGFLLLLEMTEQVPWVDFIFGLLEGWWLFDDGRNHALQPATHWDKVLKSAGYGHVDWTEGSLPEANVQRLILALASGPRYERPQVQNPPPVTSELTDPSGRQAVIDSHVYNYTKDFNTPSRSTSRAWDSSQGRCVLVTGATGSLGSHIVASLAEQPDVHTVICVNRPSTVDAIERQQKSFVVKGLSLSSSAMHKLKVLQTDTSKANLGLTAESYEQLERTVTDVVHNAWPMSITRPIRAYESQFRVMQNFIELGRSASARRGAGFKFGFQFISSIGVVGHHPLWTGDVLVKEESMTARSTLPSGYCDAKLVCEKMLDSTLNRFPDQFHSMSVRIGQIAGSTSNGYWNPVEHLAFLIKSSQLLKALPDFDGELSWCPVNDVAGTLRDLLLSVETPYLIYHIENPSRQPWKEMIPMLADALDIPRHGIIPFEQWISRIRRFPGSVTDNPAAQLADFLQHNFERMSCGGLILDTNKAREHSETLRRRGPVDRELVVKYVNAWKEMGFLYC